MLTRTQIRKLRQAPSDGPNRLRLAMTLAGLTQVELAERFGLAQSQISEDMNGKASALSLEKARRYARFFGCDVEDLFPAKQEVA